MKTFLLCMVLVPSAFASEIIVTNDGKRITGELVGYENGCYHIQIGRFVKKVNESDIQQIIDGEDTPSGGSHALTQPSVVHSTPAAAPSAPAQKTPIASSDSPKAVLDKLSASNPELMRYMEMQKSNGVSPEAMMGQVKQMQGNPAMMQMMSKFKDPAFQKTFLQNIKKMREAMNPEGKMPEDPNIQLLEGLFSQLNSAAGKKQ